MKRDVAVAIEGGMLNTLTIIGVFKNPPPTPNNPAIIPATKPNETATEIKNKIENHCTNRYPTT